jgi:hypothetical protein
MFWVFTEDLYRSIPLARSGAGVSKVSGGIVCYGCGISYVRLDGRDSILLDEVKTNVPIDDAKFGRPAPLKKR